MNKLIIKKLTQPTSCAADIPAAFAAAGTAYHTVDNVNWPKSYPYKPRMTFAMAYTDDAILIHYRIEEQSVRAVALQDQDRIWEDSCAEFFCQPVADGPYYNFECNCVGKLLVAVGKDRHERQRAPEAVLQSIDRWATLGTEPFDTCESDTAWQLALRIPFTAFFLHELRPVTGMTFRANIYKCGDLLPVPHFISWNAITTEQPDFHRPEFFGEIELS